MVFIELIIIALSALYIYYKFVIFNFWRRRNVFYIEPVVPTGNITNFITGKQQIGVFLQNSYMKYKEHRAIGMYAFFKPYLMIADPDLIREVLIKNFSSFHDRGINFNPKLNPLFENVFCVNGKRWRDMRYKMSPTFTPAKIKRMFPIAKKCSERLANYLESKAQTRDSVEMKDMFGRYTIDVIMSTAFGIKSNCIENPNNECLIQGKKFLRIKILRFILFVFLPKILDFFSISLADRETTSFFMNMFRENVERRQINNIVTQDFMNLLIQFMERGYVDPDDDKKTDVKSTINKLTMTEATAQAFVFFFAGFESSAATATFALYELAQHQDIQDRVREEIDDMLAKHADLTYEAINDMKYLKKVINETLRKYPPLPMLNRICTQDIDLPIANIRVSKGIPIVIPVLGLHRDPTIYPDPDNFDPERFNENETARRHPYAYLPFGEGPRSCIGRQSGELVIKIGLASLLSKYKFKPHPRTAKPFVYNEKSFGLAIKGGIHLTIEQR
ncbi:cytochrome P450 6k1-like isoform X1 [Temnothorax americanus]|uniref:cytochrome P450 6k1-like isoform X1 n=1 Tax=Temnothorax americanus TaxID=1964332 RepID=UPI0040678CBA